MDEAVTRRPNGWRGCRSLQTADASHKDHRLVGPGQGRWGGRGSGWTRKTTCLRPQAGGDFDTSRAVPDLDCCNYACDTEVIRLFASIFLQKMGGVVAPPSLQAMVFYYCPVVFACGLNCPTGGIPAAPVYPSCTRWSHRRCCISCRCRCAPACSFRIRHRHRPRTPWRAPRRRVPSRRLRRLQSLP